jgi:hypothetical protein
MTDRKPETEIIRARQRSGAKATAILLVVFVVLVFAVTIAKLSGNQ